MIKYVLGFALSEDKSKILLIKKNRPEWQNGLLNGIGGKVEESDFNNFEAMIREFAEETSIITEPDDWFFLTDIKGYKDLSYENFQVSWEVSVFYTFTDKIFDAISKTDEEVAVYDIDLNFIRNNSISNLPWLIGMILDKDLEKIVFEINYIK